ncbi:sigma-70 family RNA polymerase sigma factor [Arenimonas sp.]|uniref:sigma-70 family RNA polymerase sigma factor n=1 Tax=Arenimonas sp. TaxID=1872635 RepID=UPI0035B108FE
MTVTDTGMNFNQELCELLPRLRRFARTLARDPADADDLVQVALERALARAAQWRPGSRLDAWVFGIIRNAWIDEVRARQRGQRVFAPEDHGAQVGETPFEGQDLALSVQSALARLPEEQRMAIALVLIEGLSYREAALAMDVPVGTLTSRLSRGREALQGLLGGAAGAGA